MIIRRPTSSARRLPFGSLLAAAVVTVLASQAATAATRTWTGSVDAAWGTTGNWADGVGPTSADTALFDATSTANLPTTLTTSTSILGLQVTSPAGAVSIGSNTLTLGTGGIDMSAATQNLAVTSGVTLATGDQNWNVAAGRLLSTSAIPVRNGGANSNNVGGFLKAGTTGTVRLGAAATSVVADGGGNPFVSYGLDNWAATDASGNAIAATYTLPSSGTFTANTNVTVNTTGTYGVSNVAFNSVRFNNADGSVTVTNAGGSSPTYRGILMTSTAQAVTITGGNVRPNRVSVAGASFSIVNNSTIGDLTLTNLTIPAASSNTPTSVVKSGSGRLVLTGTYAGNGRIFVNDGVFQLGNGGAVGALSGTANDIVTQPGATFAVNRSNAVTISNAIIGGGQFSQLGSGSTTLAAANTFTGAVNVNAGTVVFGTASNLGNGTAINLNGGALFYSGTNTTDISTRTTTFGSGTSTINTNGNDVSFANAVGNGGAGAFTKAGTGRLTLASGGTYAGATAITGGELRVNGPLSSSAVSVAATATLSGTGSLAGAVTLGSNATLAPGNAAVGSLTVGSLTTSGGSSLIWEFNTNPANDLVVVTTPSGLTINGGAVSLFNEGAVTPFSTNGIYNLIQYSGAISGTGVGSLSVANQQAGKLYTFGTSGGFVTLSIADSGLVASWNVDASGNWTTGANWTPSEPNAAGDTAIFGAAITAPRTVTLDANRTIGNISFNNANAYTIAPAATEVLTVGDGTADKTLQVVSGSHTIAAGLVLSATTVTADIAAGHSLTLSGPISGTAALTKGVSAGTLYLTGSNSYTGGTNINLGTVEFAANALSGTAVSINGGTLRYAPGNTEDISTKTVTVGPSGATINTNGNDVTFAGGIGNAGAGGLTKAGAGTLTLAGSNSYTGSTTITGGTLAVTANSNLGDLGANAGVILAGGALRPQASLTTSRNVTVTAASVLDVANPTTLNGTITGAQPLTRPGAALLTLTGNNSSFSGGMVLAGGTTTLGGGQGNGFNAIGTGSISFQNGAVLNLNGFNASDNGTSWGTLSGPLSVASGQSGVINMPQRGTLASSLTGSGTLGLNVQFIRGELSGNWSAFTGQLNVGIVSGQTTGDLRLNTTTGFGTAAVNLAAGVSMYPVINYANNPQTFTIGELSGAAGSVLSGQGGVNSGRVALYSVGGRNTSATFAGSIRDGVVSSAVQPTAITKVGTGAWTLTGSNSHTGATTVSTGSLLVDGLITSSAVTVNATGLLGGSGTIAGAVVVNGTLSPGSSPGLITLGTLTLNPSSTTVIEVVSAGTRGVDFDAIDITGLSGLTYGGTLAFAFGGSALPENSSLTIFGFTGTPSSSLGGVTSTGFYSSPWTNLGGGIWQTISGTSVATFTESTGVLSVVPEPTTTLFAALASGGISLLLLKRRRTTDA
jgi:fibronectin-binding autotransporter adhesin